MFHEEHFIIYLLGHVYLEVLVLKIYLISKVMEGVSIKEMAGIVNDIHDSLMWKEHFHEGGLFHGNPQGIAQSLCLNIVGLTLGVKTRQLILCSQLFWASSIF